MAGNLIKKTFVLIFWVFKRDFTLESLLCEDLIEIILNIFFVGKSDYTSIIFSYSNNNSLQPHRQICPKTVEIQLPIFKNSSIRFRSVHGYMKGHESFERCADDKKHRFLSPFVLVYAFLAKKALSSFFKHDKKVKNINFTTILFLRLPLCFFFSLSLACIIVCFLWASFDRKKRKISN